MKTIEGELMSALLDGELDPESHRNTVSRLIDAGPSALGTYGRYRLIGDLMRDENALVVPVVDEVRAALRDEPTVLVAGPTRPGRWLRPVGGIALAASVAAAAVVFAPQLLPSRTANPQLVEAVPERPDEAVAPQLVAKQSLPSPSRTVGVGLDASETPRWRALNSELETRLNRLVIEHHEFAGRTGVTGPVPHISVVSYDPR